MVRWASAEGVAMLFDFYADWCQPCKQLTPKLEKLATESNGKCVLVKVDVDAHSGISDQLRIQSLPTVHAMVDGKFIDTFSGVLPDDELAAFVDRAVNVAAVGASLPARSMRRGSYRRSRASTTTARPPRRRADPPSEGTGSGLSSASDGCRRVTPRVRDLRARRPVPHPRRPFPRPYLPSSSSRMRRS